MHRPSTRRIVFAWICAAVAGTLAAWGGFVGTAVVIQFSRGEAMTDIVGAGRFWLPIFAAIGIPAALMASVAAIPIHAYLRRSGHLSSGFVVAAAGLLGAVLNMVVWSSLGTVGIGALLSPAGAIAGAAAGLVFWRIAYPSPAELAAPDVP